MSDFLTQQQQRRRFTRVAVVESEASRGAFSNKKKRCLFLNRQIVKFQGITNFFYYCYAIVMLLLNY